MWNACNLDSGQDRAIGGPGTGARSKAPQAQVLGLIDVVFTNVLNSLC